MAGGSQIIISNDGITISTGGKILYKAGQHKFEGGKNISTQLPILPNLKSDLDRKSMRFDLNSLDSISNFSNSKYRIYKNNGTFFEGTLDSRGRTKRVFTEESEELELFIDHTDFVVEEEYFIENDNSEEI